MRSFLVTDFGIANSRTVFLDVVEGQYRLISATQTYTTSSPPDSNVQIGVLRNIRQIEEQTGHPFFQKDRPIQPTQADGSGFDDFVATASSAGRPLQVTLVALMDDVSLASARRALTGSYVEVSETLTLADIQTEEQRINRILHHRPDMILIAGGTDDGNQEDVRDLVQLVELAVKLLPEGHRPIVIYAGNQRLASWAKARLDDDCFVLTAENVRPSLDRENLGPVKLKLAQAFDNFLKRQPGGFGEVSSTAQPLGITPTAQSASYLIRYLDEISAGRGAMYLDIGSGTSTLISSINGETTAQIHSNLGLGYSIEGALAALDWRDVERWLPFTFSLEDFEEWAYNKSLAPNTIPQTLRELLIEQAVAREIGRLLLNDARRCSPMIVGGAVFTDGVPPGLSAMLTLDILQPVGVTEIWLDPYALTSALGAVSLMEPVAAVQVVDGGGFLRLGTAFSAQGRGTRLGGRMRVTLTLPSGEVIKKQVMPGEIWIPTLPAGIWVDLQVRLSRGVSLDGRRFFSGRIQTGAAGLIFDMRGRTLSIPSGRRRRQAVADWFTAATGILINSEQLDAIEDESDVMTSMSGGLSEGDFPVYDRLPDTTSSPEFMALLNAADLEGVMMELPDLDEDFDDFAKELGLR